MSAGVPPLNPVPDLAAPTYGLAPDAEPAPAPTPMARLIGGGMSWFVVLNVIAKFAAFGAQILLGRMLSVADFGVYATAVAVAGFVTVFRDGGAGAILIQRGEAHYRHLIGPVFWIALAVNSATGLLLVAIAPIAAKVHGEPSLMWLLLVIAATLPLGTPGSVLMCKLRMQLRFKLVSQIVTVSAFIRYGGTVLLAWLGMGPMSFVLPLLVIAVYEGAAAYAATRDQPWRCPPELRIWASLLNHGKWLIVGTLAGIMIDMGDYFVIGFFVTKELLGIYFFANQLALQSVYTLLSHNAALVLSPALVRFAGDRTRQRAAILRFLRALMLLAVPSSVGLAVVMGPMEAWLWREKWEASVVPLQIFALLLPFRCTMGLTTGVLMAQGRFKRFAGLTIVEGAVMMAAATAGAVLGGTPVTMALATAGTMAICRLCVTTWVMRQSGIPFREVASSVFPAWITAIIGACVVLSLDSAFTHSWPSPVRFVLMGGAFSMLFVFGARLVLVRQLREALPAAPQRFIPIIERLLFLRHREARA